MALFNAVLQSCISRLYSSITSAAYVRTGTQLVYSKDMSTSSFGRRNAFGIEFTAQKKLRMFDRNEKLSLRPETIVHPKYFHSDVYSIGELFRIRGETFVRGIFPNKSVLDFFTLNEMQNSLQ